MYLGTVIRQIVLSSKHAIALCASVAVLSMLRPYMSSQVMGMCVSLAADFTCMIRHVFRVKLICLLRMRSVVVMVARGALPLVAVVFVCGFPGVVLSWSRGFTWSRGPLFRVVTMTFFHCDVIAFCSVTRVLVDTLEVKFLVLFARLVLSNMRLVSYKI